MKIKDGGTEILTKIELLGTPPEKTYKSNPIMDPFKYMDSKQLSSMFSYTDTNFGIFQLMQLISKTLGHTLMELPSVQVDLTL